MQQAAECRQRYRHVLLKLCSTAYFLAKNRHLHTTRFPPLQMVLQHNMKHSPAHVQYTSRFSIIMLIKAINTWSTPYSLACPQLALGRAPSEAHDTHPPSTATVSYRCQERCEVLVVQPKCMFHYNMPCICICVNMTLYIILYTCESGMLNIVEAITLLYCLAFLMLPPQLVEN